MTTINETSQPDAARPAGLLRAVLGGTLMGLANLVPGISGGTMLLAAGVYPHFINGIAEVTTLRFRTQTLLPLGAIVAAAALAIILGAGVIKELVVDHRWVMYSLFIGLTLGGVPVVWRLLKPMNAAAAFACAAGIAAMAAMAAAKPGASEIDPGPAYGLLFLSGLAGASAMILPGISGGYLLLILGQYIPILAAISAAKDAATAPGGPDWPTVLEAFHVFVPVGLGVAIGVVGVSNLVRIMLSKFEKATLGALLGLLLGAVLGLWPFQQGAAPQAGDVVKGRVLTAETALEVEPDDFPLEFFEPTGGQIAGSLALILAGFAATQGVAHIGRDR